MDIDRIDLSSLRRMWARRRQAAAAVRSRTDPRGMTKPARKEEERAFLKQVQGESPFREVPTPGFAEWRAGRRGRDPR